MGNELASVKPCRACGETILAEAKNCPKCGRAQTPPTSAQRGATAPPTPSLTEGKEAANYIALAFLVGIPLACVLLYNQSQKNQPPPPRVEAQAGDVTPDQVIEVRKIFEQYGAEVIRDPNAPNTIRVYMPGSLTVSMTKAEAQRLASSARSRLGDRSIVYIKTKSGDTIGKADSWGVE